MKLKTKLDKNPHLTKYDREQQRQLTCPVCKLTVSRAQARHFETQTFCFGKKDTQADADARKAKVQKRIRELTKEISATEQPPPEAKPKKVAGPERRPKKEQRQIENQDFSSVDLSFSLVEEQQQDPTAQPPPEAMPKKIAKPKGKPKKAQQQSENLPLPTDFSFSPVESLTASMSRLAQPTQQPAGQLAAVPLAHVKQRHSPRNEKEPPPKPSPLPIPRVSQPVQPTQTAPFFKEQPNTPNFLEGQQARETINALPPKGTGKTANKGKGKTTKNTTVPSADDAIANEIMKPPGKWIKKQPHATQQNIPPPEQTDRQAKPRQRKQRNRDPG